MVEEVSAGAAWETEEEVRNAEELGPGLTLGRRGRGSRCWRILTSRPSPRWRRAPPRCPQLPPWSPRPPAPTRVSPGLSGRHESVSPDSPPHGAKVSKMLAGSSEFSLTSEDLEWGLDAGWRCASNDQLYSGYIVHAFNFVAILCLTYRMVLETVKRLRIMREQMGCQSVHFGELDLNAAPGFQSFNKASEAIGSSPSRTAGNRM
ncbi:unnamed protein product, partial [Musa textilis]